MESSFSGGQRTNGIRLQEVLGNRERQCSPYKEGSVTIAVYAYKSHWLVKG